MTDDELGVALHTLQRAVDAGSISPSAALNIRKWLTDDRYRRFAPQVAEHLAAERWDALDDVFWTVLPFGTAGRRGRMYPIGCNAINEQTIGESAQGLANYLRSRNVGDVELRCAVAYDTRHGSRGFARLCCEVMAAAGFEVFCFDEFRSTPELAFAVRHLNCACGIMISASHNPPEDNAIKVFWSNGGQLRPPHDRGVMASVAEVKTIERLPLDDARQSGRVIDVTDPIDREFQRAVLSCAFPGPRELKVLYSPLHGVGATSVLPVLRADGFDDVELLAPHAEPHGDFPNVPGHVANPENPAVFGDLIERGREIGADLAVASDPDADRLGCAAPLVFGGPWRTLTGNQIAVLLADFILAQRQAAGSLGGDHYIVTTLVTTGMLRGVADYYGVRIFDNLLTGFKWIGGVIDEQGPAGFLFAAEEAHGYLVGDYVRDKDAAGATMILAELAARAKREHRTLHQELDRIYARVGYHAESATSRTFPGAAGMAAMKTAMQRLRSTRPETLGGMRVVRSRDYLLDVSIRPRADGQVVGDAECDLAFFDLERPGYTAAVRPSGTEPKLKFYVFAREETAGSEPTQTMRRDVAAKLGAIERDLLQVAGVSS